MDPKFQSSFIPKGSFAPTSTGSPLGRKIKERSLVEFLAMVIFILSVLLAMGVYGYKYYLKYQIGKMGIDLEQAQATLQPETIHELTRLNDRINSTKELISKHRALSPLFEFFEAFTPKTLRFSDFRYLKDERGLGLSIKGEARGYAALAFAADTFNKSGYFTDSTFSDLNLNDKGDVSFSFEAIVEPDLLSYNRVVERISVPNVSTSSPQTATSTRN